LCVSPRDPAGSWEDRAVFGRFWLFWAEKANDPYDRETIHMDCVVIGVNRFAIQANRRTIHMD